MTLTAAGNVGIGTTSPGAKLDVAGVAQAYKSGKGTINALDTASYAAGVGGTIDLGGNYRATGDYQAFVRIAAEKANATNNDYGYNMGFYVTTNGGATLGTKALTIDSSGNLGIGTSSPTNTSNYTTLQIQGTTGGIFRLNNSGNTIQCYGGSDTAGGFIGTSTNHPFVFYTNGTERARIDSSGNLSVNTTSAIAGAANRGNITIGGSAGSILSLGTSASAYGYLFYDTSNSSMELWNYSNSFMRFGTNNTERGRFTAGGYFKASNDGTYASSTDPYHELRSNANNRTVFISNSIASGYTDTMIQAYFSGYSPNTTTSWFLYCNDTTAQRAAIRSNGGLANYQANNVDLSDARTKNSITPAASMWDKVAALEIVTYKYNDQTHDDVNLGVIAQQVESVEPVWVDSDGWGDEKEGEEPLKTVYTKDITFAAIKALQEAMARIEQLEAKVAVLENK
jgi:hypothetical protein